MSNTVVKEKLAHILLLEKLQDPAKYIDNTEQYERSNTKYWTIIILVLEILSQMKMRVEDTEYVIEQLLETAKLSRKLRGYLDDLETIHGLQKKIAERKSIQAE